MHLFSLAFANIIVAMMLGGVIGGWLPLVFRPMFADSLNVQLLSYRAVLVVGALLYFVSLLPLALIKEGKDEQREGRDENGRATPQGESIAYKFALNSLLIGLGAGLVVLFFNLYFYRRFECSTEQIGLFIAIAHGMMALAVLTGPILSRRFGKLRAIVGIQLSSLPFLLVLGISRLLPLSLIAYWARAALMNTPAPITSNLMMDLLPERRRATVNSLTIAVGSLGRAFATLAGGWMIQESGWAAPFLTTSLLYAM